jgi:hypothetical protein
MLQDISFLKLSGMVVALNDSTNAEEEREMGYVIIIVTYFGVAVATAIRARFRQCGEALRVHRSEGVTTVS